MGDIRLKLAEAEEGGSKAPRFAPAGHSTQLIVGADSSNDASILETADTLYRSYRLKRVYYSAFSPIPHSSIRLPNRAPPLMREHRLYQADWLLRYYGFSVGELTGALPHGELDLALDPKTSWALAPASKENPRLLEDEADRDVRHARSMERAVERECHKMHAFVRFRELTREDGVLTWFAWFEPEHEVLPRAAPFFANRFANATWTIATPDGAAVGQNGKLSFIDAPLGNLAPRHDAQESLWRTYYRSVCNLARINPRAMQREMPRRYWRNLPETAEISILLRDGRERFSQRHRELDDSALRTPISIQRALADLPSFERGPAACRRCDLWRHATQAVPGAGPANASVLHHPRGARVVCTYHPSAILRAEPGRAPLLRERSVRDLRRAREMSAD